MAPRQLGHHCNQPHHLDQLVLANGLARAELYNWRDPDPARLRAELAQRGIVAGAHAPLLHKAWYPFTPTWMFLHDADPERRALSLRLALETIDDAAAAGLAYIVIHFPGPQSAETAALPIEVQRDLCWEALARLDERGREQGVSVHLEGFGPHPLFTGEFLGEVFEALPGLGYCWDSGHMHYAAQRDGFDYWVMAEHLRPHVRSLQLWANRTFSDYQTHHHIPVHPSQDPTDGWVDIVRTLVVLVSGRPDVPVVIESPPYYPPELGGHDYREGIRWVADTLAAIST
jgi:sugar phosphate isomerase/epimerase